MKTIHCKSQNTLAINSLTWVCNSESTLYVFNIYIYMYIIYKYINI